MTKRLVKIAKELNVGTTTIVDYLNDNGFEIENKPTAKITDAMYAELLKEFQKSIAIKEQADQLVIGTRNTPAKKEREVVESEVAEAPATQQQHAHSHSQEPVAKTTTAAPESKEETERTPRLRPKILGKIDLSARRAGKKDSKENKTAPAEPEPKQPAAEPEAKTPAPEEKEPTPPQTEKTEKPQEKKPEPESKSEKKTEPAAEKPKPEKAPEPEPESLPADKTEPVAETQTPEPEPEAEKPQEEKALQPKAETPAPPEAEEKTKPETKEETAAPSTPGEKDETGPAKEPEQQATPPVEEEKAPKEEAPQAKEEPTAPEKKPKAPEKAPKQEEPKGDEEKPEAEQRTDSDEEAPKRKGNVIRAEAPELRGLKIQGKIDLDKLKPKKKKKKTTTAKSGSDSPGTENKTQKPKEEAGGGESQDVKKKRRRKRRKVSAPSEGGGDNRSSRRKSDGRRGGKRQDDVKEVSQKEIDEKIKATMARLSGGGKKKRQKIRRETRERLKERQEQRELEQQNDKLQVTEFISVQELANLMDVDATSVIMTCMNLGVIVSINQRLDAEIIELVAEEFGHEVEFISVEEQTEEEYEIDEEAEDLESRAPIVTVMGHVDHGKTSLLDYIRKANVASGEAGGITQHIGAYEVEVGEENKRITFLDTPGHEAFTAMRARGAKVTDIAIIIISADDNIMPQTREAISHSQAAGVPMVFAINKVDKAGANPEKIKQELASMNLLVEEWGGKYQSQDISAKTGQGIDSLLEKVLLEAELLELQANTEHEAWGTILEASLDKGRGYVAKALVQNGSLEIGDAMVAGEHSGKVKAMFNEHGKRVKVAGPSTPVLILGLDGAPQAGERFKIVENEQEARQIAGKRGQIAREQANRATKRISLDEIGRRLALGNFKELNLIVKGDVDGSIEALSDSLIKLSQETVKVNVIHKAVGQIIESDVLLASASDAIIIGFQVRPSGTARKLAEKEGVEINTYSIIYEAIEEVKMAIEGMLEPTKEENIIGEVEVRETYKISKVGTVAGCYVTDGKLTRNTHIRLIRDGIVVYPTKEGQHGEIASLKRFKDDVKEVRAGIECGISIKNFNDIKVGDIIEGYEIVEIKQKLE